MRFLWIFYLCSLHNKYLAFDSKRINWVSPFRCNFDRTDDVNVEIFCLSSHSRIFHSYGDVTITGEGLKILNMAIEQWGFFSVPHLLFIMVISEDPWHSEPIAERLAMELSLTVFTTWVCRGWDSNNQPSGLQDQRSKQLRHRRGEIFCILGI